MKTGQHGRRRDANEPEIIRALEQIGCRVFRLSDAGLPDLLISFRGEWSVLECKMPNGKLTPAQELTWQLSPFPVVESANEAIALFGVGAPPA